MATMMQVHAKAKGIRIAPRKLGLVAGLVRGHTVTDALTILQHTPKKAAPVLGKVISSAAANAAHNHNVDATQLTLEHVHIGHGPRARRYFAAAKGQARPFMKRSTHIHIIVSGPQNAKAATPAKTSSSTASTARIATKDNKRNDK